MRYSAFICFSSFEGSINSLVKKDQVEVCMLSHGMILFPQSLSNPLQAGVRFFYHPLPHPHRLPLRVAFPFGRDMGFTSSAQVTMTG